MSTPSTTDRPAATRTGRTTPAFFDQWSATYDSKQLQALTYRPIHEAMLRRLHRSEPALILDLGCGTGQFLEPLAARFTEATILGVDLSEGMLTKAAARLADQNPDQPAGTALVRSDAQFLPIASASVDVITCSESFHWYPDQRATLAEIGRVLRPDGRLLLASIAATSDVGDAVMRRMSRAAGQPFRALAPRRLAGLLEASGFEISRQRRIPRLGLIPWPVLTDARRR